MQKDLIYDENVTHTLQVENQVHSVAACSKFHDLGEKKKSCSKAK